MENQADFAGFWLSEDDYVSLDSRVIGFQLAPIQIQASDDDLTFDPQA
jgi:hypothetical protein